MCACTTRAYGLETVMARGFAFVGPHLPLDRHFAIGNFIRDAIRGGPIVVSGDGTPIRSYQYAADMAIWLWGLLARGASGRAYNVGASREITVGELARLVAATAGNGCGVEVRRDPTPGAVADRYLPDVRLATETLGLRESISLEEGIARTMRWHGGLT
jgi:dTDP-glucose 4,6-dehydratase